MFGLLLVSTLWVYTSCDSKLEQCEINREEAVPMAVDCGDEIGDLIGVTYCGSSSGMAGFRHDMSFDGKCFATKSQPDSPYLFMDTALKNCEMLKQNYVNKKKLIFFTYNMIIRKYWPLYTIICSYSDEGSSWTIQRNESETLSVTVTSDVVNTETTTEGTDLMDIPNLGDVTISPPPTVSTKDDIVDNLKKHTIASLIVTSNDKMIQTLKTDSIIRLHLTVQSIIDSYSARVKSCFLEDKQTLGNTVTLFYNGCGSFPRIPDSLGFSHNRINTNVKLISPQFKLPGKLNFPNGFYFTCNVSICQQDGCIQTCPDKGTNEDFSKLVIKSLRVSYGRITMKTEKDSVRFAWENDLAYYIIIGVLFMLIIFVLIVIVVLVKSRHKYATLIQNRSPVHPRMEEYTPGKKPKKNNKITPGADSGYNPTPTKTSPELPPFPSFNDFETLGRNINPNKISHKRSNEVSVGSVDSRGSIDGLNTDQRQHISAARFGGAEAGIEEEQITLINNRRPDNPPKLTKL